MLEMLRNVLDIMQRNKTFRAQLDQNYKQRALESHLRSVPVFASLTPEFIESPAGSRGTGALSAGTGDLPPGRGGRQLLSGPARLCEGFARTIPGRVWCWPIWRAAGTSAKWRFCSAAAARTATCTALDHVEVVRIPGDDFRAMLEQFPEVRRELEEVAQPTHGREPIGKALSRSKAFPSTSS